MKEAWLFLLRKIKQNKAFFLFFAFILLISLINISLALPDNQISGDTASVVVMATAPFRGLGVPYSDYWEFKPPGIFLLVGLWLNFLGDSLFSFKILQLLFLLGTGTLTYLVLKKIFSPFYAFVVGVLAILVLFSPLLFSIFLPSELFGLFFSLAGLTSLLYLEKFGPRFFLSTFLFILASQMKDPFSFTFLALIPPLLYFLISRDYKKFLMASTFVVGGFLVAIFLFWSYLSVLGSFGAYLEVLDYKSQVHDMWRNLGELEEKLGFSFQHAKNILMFFQYQVSTVLLFWVASFFLRSKAKTSNLKNLKKLKAIFTLRLNFTPKALDALIIIFYSTGSFIGFTIAEQFGSHYLIQVVLPIFFFWAIIGKSFSDNLYQILGTKKVNYWLSLTILAILLFPKGPYVKSYHLESYLSPRAVSQICQKIFLADTETKLENYISAKTPKDSCILSVYGWGSGRTYFYAQRRPCTRFFLANIVQEDWQKKEYRESLLHHPPQAIVYTKLEADMDILRFEQEAINLSQIIEQCYYLEPQFSDYSQSNLNLYLPRYFGSELKMCLRQSSV